MTSFCTAQRHKNNNRSSTPTLGPGGAASRQLHGLARLASFSKTTREIVTLPTIASMETHQRSHSHVTSTTSTTQTTPRGTPLQSRPSTPQLATVELTAAERIAKEQEELRQDRVAAEQEFMRYIGIGRL
jgi:hypothetical protein